MGKLPGCRLQFNNIVMLTMLGGKMEDWDFEDNECWWDVDYQAVKFDGWLDGDRYVFAISGMALNDYYQTEDTTEAALENYLENAEQIEYVAARYASDFEANDESPHYFITSEIYNKYAP